MEEIMKEFVQGVVAQQDKIIKEVAEQGYKYLVMKKEVLLEGNSAKQKIKYHGFHSIEGLEVFEEKGYEVFDLTKVIEYLKTQKEPEGN